VHGAEWATAPFHPPAAPAGFESTETCQYLHRRLGITELDLRLAIRQIPSGVPDRSFCREPGRFCEIADESLKVIGAKLAFVIFARREPDAHARAHQLEQPTRADHLERGHSQGQPRLSQARCGRRVLAHDRHARRGCAAPDGLDQCADGGSKSAQVGAGQREGAVATRDDTGSTTGAALDVDDDTASSFEQRPVATRGQAPGARGTASAALLTADSDGAQRELEATEQGPSGDSRDRKAGPLPDRRLRIDGDDTCQPGPQQRDRLLQDNPLIADLRRLQVDDVGPNDRDTGSPEAREQPSAGVRGGAAPQNDACRAKT
jgi:hypothetical protein